MRISFDARYTISGLALTESCFAETSPYDPAPALDTVRQRKYDVAVSRSSGKGPRLWPDQKEEPAQAGFQFSRALRRPARSLARPRWRSYPLRTASAIARRESLSSARPAESPVRTPDDDEQHDAEDQRQH